MTKKITYLDGLRGIAAFIVVISHFIQIYYPALFTMNTLQIHNDVEFYIGTSPLNVFYNGNFSVCIFFVLSGFVLSYKYFQTGDMEVIKESVIKRYVRLAIPVSFSIFIVYVINLFDGFTINQILHITKSDLVSNYNLINNNFFYMLQFAFFETFFKGNAIYNPVLWTMKYELFGSYLIFLFIIILKKSNVRYLVYVILILSFFNSYFLGFILGLLLSDLYLNKKINIFSIFDNIFVRLVTGIGGIFLGSYPYLDTSNTIYKYLKINIDGYDSLMIYHICGAFLLMIFVLSSPYAKKVLSGKLFLFLGKISFSLYLLHFTLLCSFSSYIFVNLIRMFSYDLSVLLTFLISTPLMILCSYFMYKYIDNSSIRISKKFYNKYKKYSVRKKQVTSKQLNV